MRKEKVEIFDGDVFVDDRGTLRFVNTFPFKGVKRFYQIENFDKKVIRAFHGHMKEGKYFYVPSGTILLCAAPMSDPKDPSKEVKVERLVMSAKKPRIVFIPPGYANGFRSLEKNTSIVIFSTSSLEESKGDDYRFPYDYWGTEIWEVENR
jgi:dTDP-4-dehydrorhamnose 3,5-epimerase